MKIPILFSDIMEKLVHNLDELLSLEMSAA